MRRLAITILGIGLASSAFAQTSNPATDPASSPTSNPASQPATAPTSAPTATAPASTPAVIPPPVEEAPFSGVLLLDPSGDDNGPGTYTYPSNAVYEKGSFDLV